VNQTFRALLILLTAFTFIGSVGFPVFTHICKEDGAFRSLFTKEKMHCSIESTAKLPPCCALKLAKDPKEKFQSNCCEEQTDLFKLRFDYKNDQSLHYDWFVEASTCAPTAAFILYQTKEANIHGKHYRPPPLQLSGQELLIEHQVFRI
jgi:hypothetical protein